VGVVTCCRICDRTGYSLANTKEPAFVVNASLLPSKVLGLEIARPQSFHYQPGDYVFVKCPSLSKYEWHPFTISSAPEISDVLSVHIRSAGSWTGKLYQLFREQHEQWIRSGNSKYEPGVLVHLDGPYGTPSTHIFESKYAILIGAGIGVTPFASILKSMLYRSQHGSSGMRLQKVHFYWLNREQKAFEWFVELLSRIEAEDTNNLFDINLYLTGAQASSDMKSSTLFVAMDLMHAQTQVDLITGLKVRTKTGRPDWDTIFAMWQSNTRPIKLMYISAVLLDSRYNCEISATNTDLATGKKISSKHSGNWCIIYQVRSLPKTPDLRIPQRRKGLNAHEIRQIPTGTKYGFPDLDSTGKQFSKTAFLLLDDKS
jgi:NAD(P)H-flavin reductase